jgi:hypothetical protein
MKCVHREGKRSDPFGKAVGAPVGNEEDPDAAIKRIPGEKGFTLFPGDG